MFQTTHPADWQQQDALNRRTFLQTSANGLGAMALGCLLGQGRAEAAPLGQAHFAPKAKRLIYLFQSGGPAQMDLFDPKPQLEKHRGQELPDSIRGRQRLTGMTSNQKTLPVAPTKYRFTAHGQSGLELSEMLPNFGRVADELCVVRSIHSEAINHDPAITYINTGTQQLGHPSMGAWLNYGLGSLSDDLPGYIVMISKGRGGSQALYSRLWGSGFLPSKHQGVKFRSSGEPVLYLNNPPGITSGSRRAILDSINAVNRAKFEETQDSEIQTRIAQYEMAFRMQASVPELTDLKTEPDHVFEQYGKDAKTPGKFAYNCILARRMLERGVPFVQLFHRGWDQHGNCPRDVRRQCEDVDQPAAALVRDLKQRGMLEDTIVICGGEFGRTIYSQGSLTKDNHGRDHHGRCFTMWMAGGGIRKGHVHGETDDFSYNIVRDPVHINDLNATVLQCLGIDHERFTYRYQGLDQRLTGVQGARVVNEILA